MPGCVGGRQTCALRGYDDQTSVNTRIDDAVTVRLDENNNLIINEWLSFRPSEILHALDRIAYNDVVTMLYDFEKTEPEAGQ